MGFVIAVISGIGSKTAVGAEQARPAVAVFALKDIESGIERRVLEMMSEYVGTAMVRSGRFEVVPSSSVKEALARQKRDSYRPCYAESCQIEIGREVAAAKTLAGSVARVGRRCIVTLKLFDLVKATQEAAGTAKGPCTEDDVLDTLEAAVGDLLGSSNSHRPVVEAPPPAPPSPSTPGLLRTLVKMVEVPAGPFIAGCKPDDGRPCPSDAKSQRTVRVQRFAIDQTEVTVAAFRACVRANLCRRRSFTTKKTESACNWGHRDRDQHPMNCISWAGADAYCSAVGKRLPTEREWEKAARGTDGRRYPWGNTGFGQRPVANIADKTCKSGRWWCNFGFEGYEDGFVETAPVGRFPQGQSPFGAFDMIGNVSEWTSGLKAGTRWHIARGGGWFTRAAAANSFVRQAKNPSDKGDTSMGFRCARSLPEDANPKR